MNVAASYTMFEVQLSELIIKKPFTHAFCQEEFRLFKF
jgi:hypothetical protein